MTIEKALEVLNTLKNKSTRLEDDSFPPKMFLFGGITPVQVIEAIRVVLKDHQTLEQIVEHDRGR